MDIATSAPSKPIQTLGLDSIEQMLDHLPHAPFFIKDEALRYVSANEAMVSLCGLDSREQLIGTTAREHFPAPAWHRYEIMDRQVMRSARPMRDRLDLAVRARGAPVWLLFGRWPVIADNRVVGVMAIARILDSPDRRHPAYERVAAAVGYMHDNVSAPVDIRELAHRAGVSVSQLERSFMNVFGLPPRRYLTKVRMETALEMLRATCAIVEIAHACGYADQSAFTRRFRAAVGMSPTEYRRKFA